MEQRAGGASLPLTRHPYPSGVINNVQANDRDIDDLFADMLEIDRDERADSGLHPTKAPIGPGGQANSDARGEAAKGHEPSRRRGIVVKSDMRISLRGDKGGVGGDGGRG